MRQWIVAAALALTANVAHAQDALDPHAARVANQVSYEIMSPFCPGKTLAMCPSPAAAEVRMQLQQMAESGMSEAQIRDAVIEEHGEEFRTVEPPWTDNLGLLIGLLGALLVAVGVVRLISTARKVEPTTTAASTSTSDEVGGDDELDDQYLAELRQKYRD